MNNKVFIDIDKNRIYEIVSEALRMTRDFLPENDLSREDSSILEDLKKILESNMVSTCVYLNVPCKSIPDLKLRVNPILKKVLYISSFKKKVAKINHHISIL